jgi:CBS domain containing-hemolysin-like protein
MKSNNTKQQIAKFKKDNKKKEKGNKSKVNYNWIIKITLLAFVISFVFSSISENVIPNVNIFIGILLVIIFIAIGVVFDMIGIAVTSADEKPFHSMSAQKIRGANVAVMFIKNADKVSSFCNDVIGDICGIISGSAGAIIANTLAIKFNIDIIIMTLFIMALIAAFTIGGKALGKGFAIRKCNTILYDFAKVISYFYNGKK